LCKHNIKPTAIRISPYSLADTLFFLLDYVGPLQCTRPMVMWPPISELWHTLSKLQQQFRGFDQGKLITTTTDIRNWKLALFLPFPVVCRSRNYLSTLYSNSHCRLPRVQRLTVEI